MRKIIAFGASSSKQSINKKLASYAASQINGCESIILNLEDFEMPIYSIDKEEEKGFFCHCIVESHPCIFNYHCQATHDHAMCSI